MTLDEILNNLKNNPEKYNTGISKDEEKFERFDRDE